MTILKNVIFNDPKSFAMASQLEWLLSWVIALPFASEPFHSFLQSNLFLNESAQSFAKKRHLSSVQTTAISAAESVLRYKLSNYHGTLNTLCQCKIRKFPNFTRSISAYAGCSGISCYALHNVLHHV